VRQFKGKKSRGRPRHKSEDDIKMDGKETERESTNWIDMVQDLDKWRASVKSVTNISVV
jgi:hypothetical protein